MAGTQDCIWGERLTVLSVAYPQFAVSADASGGSEQVLHLLEREIAAAGCRSIVIAASGSKVSGELVETPAMGQQITDADRREASRVHLQRIEETVAKNEVDLIHFHGLDFATYLPEFAGPKVVTVHLPATWYRQDPFCSADLTFCCVSETQARSFPGERRPLVIPNAIEVDAYQPIYEAGDYLLWIGRICPEKGVHVALRVARKLDLPLIVAGPVHPFPDHQKYYAEQVKPMLDEKRKWVGAAGQNCKASLLAGAKCLLHPSSAPETSSLVAMEAASSGTPVVAFRSGALPEIVEDGRTGFVVDGEAELAGAIERIEEISRKECRRRAEERFSPARMTRDYLALYKRLTGPA